MNRFFLAIPILLMHVGCTSVNKKPDVNFSDSLALVHSVEPLPTLPKAVAESPKSHLPLASLSVVDAPAVEVLKALAKDLNLDFDVESDIQGPITMMANQRPIDEILNRMSDQVAMVWTFDAGRISVRSDRAFARVYSLPLVNATTHVISDSQFGDTNGLSGGNVSVKTQSEKNFWLSVSDGVKKILATEARTTSEQDTQNPKGALSKPDVGKTEVSLAPDLGLLTVVATTKQHRQVTDYINRLQIAAKRQVYVDVKMIEVKLDSSNELGIDWKSLKNKGLVSEGNFVGAAMASSPHLMIGYVAKNFEAHLRALGEQGKARMLSQPKLLVQNGQAASIRATDSLVYFTTMVSQAQTSSTGVITPPVVTTTPHTIDVGVTMTLMPAISSDGSVNLHIRPRVTRLVSYVKDPNPLLAEQHVESQVPQIEQREMESTMLVEPDKELVLGGLILEAKTKNYVGAPFSEQLPRWLSWLNWVVGYNKEQSNRSELVFLISCHVDNGVST